MERFSGICNNFCDESALPLFYHIGQILMEREDLGNLINRVVNLTASELDLNRVLCSVYDPSTGSVVLEGASGISPFNRGRTHYSIGEGITGTVLETGEAMIIPKISEETQFAGKTGWDLEVEYSFVCVPIPVRGGILGTLSAARIYDENFDLKMLRTIMTILCNIIAQTVQLYQWETVENQAWKDEKFRLQQQLEHKYSIANMVGKSRGIRELGGLIQKIAPTSTTVLILGESGSGKELVASELHYSSPRKDGPFLTFNCGALPESLAESELFGHEKGSFTGALQTRIGLFEAANNGTLFLDEIGDLALSLQVKLLRIIQQKELTRIGSHKVIKTDVRIVAATHRDLNAMVKAGTFREDLYFRLSTFPLSVPPLRQRGSDVYLLADHFVEKYNGIHNREIHRISTTALEMLGAYHWPGNVRELENTIERAVILAETDTIQGHDLPPSLQTPRGHTRIEENSLQEQLDRLEYDLLVDALKLHRGNMSQAGEQLGLSKRMMGLRMKKYGLDYRYFRGVTPA